MPGSLILSVLSFLASHLVLLVFVGFIVVGVRLAETDGTAALQASAPGEAYAPPQRPRVETAITGPAEEAAELRDTATRQPAMIGGTLPNYASRVDERFRPPPRAADPLPPIRSDRESLVQAARRAFWNGDFEAAEAAYVSLISRYPDDADAFGELGNLYQSMGKSALSLDAYHAAAVRLRASGRWEKLSEVIDLLESHDYPDTAQLRP